MEIKHPPEKGNCSCKDCYKPTPKSEPSEWEERGYRFIPQELEDLDLDHEGIYQAEKEKAWVLGIRKDEADLFIKQLLSRHEQSLREKLEGEIEGLKRSDKSVSEYVEGWNEAISAVLKVVRKN